MQPIIENHPGPVFVCLVYAMIGIGWCASTYAKMARADGPAAALGFSFFIMALWPFTLGKMFGVWHRQRLFGPED